MTVPSPAVADDTETRPLTLTTSDGLDLEAEVRLPAPGLRGDDTVTGASCWPIPTRSRAARWARS